MHDLLTCKPRSCDVKTKTFHKISVTHDSALSYDNFDLTNKMIECSAAFFTWSAIGRPKLVNNYVQSYSVGHVHQSRGFDTKFIVPTLFTEQRMPGGCRFQQKTL